MIESSNKPLESNSLNSGYLVLIFIFWPFIAFLLACADYRNKISRKIILAFFALYGLLFYLNPLMDGYRRAEGLKVIAEQPFSNLFNTFANLYEESLDFVEPVLIFTISRFTDFHGILFAVYALIFGSLMLYYLRKMYGHYESNKNANTLMFLIFLICANPIYNIGGFRMWTASWIYAICVLNYIHKPNFKYVLLSACAFLVHFSFFPLIIMFMLYTFLKNRVKIYGLLAISTFFVAELNISQVRQYAALFGAASERKITAYTYEGHIETVAEGAGNAAWYVQFINGGVKYFILFCLLFIFYKTKGQFKSKFTASFYSFSLLILSFANISGLLPSGSRFYKVYYIFAYTTILLYYIYENSERKLNTLNRIGVPILALFIIFTFRLFSDTASAYLLGPSFMMPFALIENISLQTLIF
ncbi:MAG: EpsG family protein [Flavobacterium sp.]